MTYVIAQPCIGSKDSSCVEVCPWTASTRPWTTRASTVSSDLLPVAPLRAPYGATAT
jgi:hypothetical protein